MALPKTFHDAMDFVRRLRMQYLWIDLCAPFRTMRKIGRPKQQKWHLSTTMRFRQSLLRARRVTKGVVAMPLLPSLLRLGMRSKTPESLQFPYLLGENHLIWGFGGGLSQRVPEFPLLGRAWVYQELLLSLDLHFTPSEIIWNATKALNASAALSRDARNLVLRTQPESTLPTVYGSSSEMPCQVI